VIARFLASLLEPAEREAVLGDLAERGASRVAAIRELLGLAVRRQAAPWLGWRPWTALLFLIVPFSLVLSFDSRISADIGSDALWMYFHNGDWNRLPQVLTLILMCPCLACWSWIVGFAIGALSRRTAVTNAAIFCLFLLLEQFATGSILRKDGPVYAVWFYRSLLAFSVQIFVVLIPAVLGMQQGLRFCSFDRLMRWALIGAAILSAVPMAWIGLVWFEHFTNRPAAGPLFNRLIAQHWLSLVNWWPILYWIAQVTGRLKEKTA
jgi:hypothetical protein